MKKLIGLIVVLLVIVMAVSLGKDVVIKNSVEKAVNMVTGLKLTMQSMKVGVIRTLVDITNLRLFNPEGYADKVMIDMPRIYVNYDLLSIIRGKIHLSEVTIDLKEFVVVKNEKGELNLDSLKMVKEQKEAAGAKPAEKGKAPEMQIDLLKLKIGKVIYKDYSKGATPSVKEFDINLDESYKNVTDPKSIATLIIVKALMNTTIGSLTGFDVGGLQNSLAGTLGGAQEALGGAATAAGGLLSGTTKAGGETVKSVEDTVKNVFSSPFGTKKQ